MHVFELWVKMKQNTSLMLKGAKHYQKEAKAWVKITEWWLKLPLCLLAVPFSGSPQPIICIQVLNVAEVKLKV